MTASDVPSPRNGTAYQILALTVMSHRIAPDGNQSQRRFPNDADLLFFEYLVVGECHLAELRASVGRHLSLGFSETAIDDGKVGDRDHNSGAEGQISD